MTMTAIDVFSGCGGLTTGLKKAGFDVVGAVEIDPNAAEVFALNHPEVHLWQQDVASLRPKQVKTQLKLKAGELDMLAGCPPCQGFSRVTTLNGGYQVTDERNDLIFEFLRLVNELSPKTVMLENVPGLADDGRLTKFCKALESQGYSVDFDVLDVSDYAVPQRRRRLVLLAGKNGPIPFAKPARVRRTVEDAIGSLPPAGVSGDKIHDIAENRSARIRELIAAVPKDGGSRRDLPEEYELECHKKCDGFKDVYGRMSWGALAPTLTTGCFNPSKGRFLHPEENRAITMREAAMLQSFPKSYKFVESHGKVAIAIQIGNAIPPEFVRRHATCAKRYLESSEQSSS